MRLDRPAYITAATAAIVVGLCVTQQLTSARPIEPTLSSGAGAPRDNQALSAPSNHLSIEPQAAQEAILPQSIGPPIAAAITSSPGPLDRLSTHDLRVKKCRLIANKLYPTSGFGKYVEFFISEHERLNMGEEWWWSLAYGGANCSLRCNIRFRNGCAGPMDRPRGPIDPQANIRAHCREWFSYYRRGIVGYQAARHVFYPRRPHDWRGAEYRRMIWGHHAEHLRLIEAAYEKGDLP